MVEILSALSYHRTRRLSTSRFAFPFVVVSAGPPVTQCWSEVTSDRLPSGCTKVKRNRDFFSSRAVTRFSFPTIKSAKLWITMILSFSYRFIAIERFGDGVRICPYIYYESASKLKLRSRLTAGTSSSTILPKSLSSPQ